MRVAMGRKIEERLKTPQGRQELALEVNKRMQEQRLNRKANHVELQVRRTIK